MIDLHCHLLPGIDDGARDIETSVAMARAAVDGGVEAIVATPHVSGTYQNNPNSFPAMRDQVQAAIDEAGVPLRVHTGAEIAMTWFESLDDDALKSCALGGGRYVLLEPPLNGPAPFLDRMVVDLGSRGYNALIAHPERIAWFQKNVGRLEALVDKGAICSITAGSIRGQFGGHVKKFTLELFKRGLVHNIASDAHDAQRRSPALGAVLERATEDVDGLDEWLEWMTVDVPRAIVGGELVQGDPPALAPKGGLMRRLRRR